MTTKETRRRRLGQLLGEYQRQQDLADKMGVEQNYISQLLTGKKAFGEKTARKIEKAAGKPEKWLDEAGEERPVAAAEWPFGFDRELWYRLSAVQRREIEAALVKMVLGANIEQAASGSAKRRHGS